jgi:hypothetical protein
MVKFIVKLFLVFFLLLLNSVAFSQERTLTQEEFAVQLVKNMKLDSWLPIAALPSDCVTLLESLGISPLKGWNRKALLTDDDFTVIIAKSVGKERLVHIKAAEVCHRNIEIINERWRKNPDLTLEELLNNEDIFPNGSPQCPYGLKYQDTDSNHKVDQHYHPIAFFKR